MLEKILEIRGSKLFLVDKRFPDYHETDVTPVFHFFQDFYKWKQDGQPLYPPLE